MHLVTNKLLLLLPVPMAPENTAQIGHVNEAHEMIGTAAGHDTVSLLLHNATTARNGQFSRARAKEAYAAEHRWQSS